MTFPNDTDTPPEQKAASCGCADKDHPGPDQTGTSARTAADMGPQMPEVTFTTFILSLASSALVHLGEVPEPESGQAAENILMAKHTIDVLCMLREKTSGGLDSEEKKLLDGLLYELRMKYVLKTK